MLDETLPIPNDALPKSPSPRALPPGDVVAVPVGMDDDLAHTQDLLTAVVPVEVVFTGHDAEVHVTARKVKKTQDQAQNYDFFHK